MIDFRSAAIGGTFAGTSAALLTKLLPSDQLRAEADRMLETMGKNQCSRYLHHEIVNYCK